MFDIVPLTIVIDYLKDDVGEKMEMFMNLHKIIEKNINEDFEEINKNWGLSCYGFENLNFMKNGLKIYLHKILHVQYNSESHRT